MHCDPHSHPRHKHRVHTKLGAFDRLQSDFQKKKKFKKARTNVHMTCCMFVFISLLAACVRGKKKVDPGGQNEAGIPSMNLSCKAASTSEALSCVRLHLSTGLGWCGARNHWDVLMWSHLGWTNRSQADMWLAATPRGQRSVQISANLGRHGMSLYTCKEGALAYNPYLLRPLKFFSLT